MQRTEERAGMSSSERTRVEAVVETLATVGCEGESVAEVAHDARNMVTALGLYCDLLEEPGVLATPFTHYGNELRLVAAASRRLVEKLVALDGRREAGLLKALNTKRGQRVAASSDMCLNPDLNVGLDASGSTSLGSRAAVGTVARPGSSVPPNAPFVGAPSGNMAARGHWASKRRETPGRWDLMPAAPIENLAAELLANHNLLAALAGPATTVTVDVEGGARPVRLTGEDLTRVLVNLVKNAAESMQGSGRIQIELHQLAASAGTTEALALTIEDSGPGIADEALEEIFASGFTTRAKGAEAKGSWPVIHRGLGLAIARSIVEAAGGRIAAANRGQWGARFEIELPVRKA